MLLVNKEQGIRIKIMIKELLKKLVLGKRYSSETYIDYLRKIGVKIGEDCTIYVPSKTLIDEQYPWMITIGNHVRITEGVKILTHDYSWSVIKGLNGAILGASGKVEIGNNVFIGMNTIVCRGVKIGDNVIIGAGSIVTKDCNSNYVYAGNPAKQIMSITEYLEKRKSKQILEAKTLAREYYLRFKKKPNESVFHEYFMLYSSEKEIENNLVYKQKMQLGDNELVSRKYMEENVADFRSFDEFLQEALKGLI